MSIQAKFIGGPWDGMVIAVCKVLPTYEIAEMQDVEWGARELSAEKWVPPATVCYRLYDDWPVKYLLEGLF